MKIFRVLLNGGGSGGHIYPLLAVIEALQGLGLETNRPIELRYIGAPKQYEMRLKASGASVRRIMESKLRRYFSLAIIWDFIKFIFSLPQAFWYVFWFMPDVAFSKGGPGALAVLYACRFYRVPIVIHESDAIPGLTTRLAVKFASKVTLSFAGATTYLPDNFGTETVGNPVRNELVFGPNERTPEARAAAKLALGFSAELPLIVVLGGSQGATAINRFILDYLQFLLEKYQVLHQTGLSNYPEHHRASLAAMENTGEKDRERYKDVPFLERDLRTALMAADLVISRSGAGAIFEIAAAGKASILIPLENSASDHQNENAFQYREAGACAVLKEENMGNAAVVQHLITSLMADETQLKKMSENAKLFAKPSAAKDLALIILNFAKS